MLSGNSSASSQHRCIADFLHCNYGFERNIRIRYCDQGLENSVYIINSKLRGRYVFRVYAYRSRQEVEFEIALLRCARDTGFKCPQPISRCDGALVSKLGANQCLVYPYIEGNSPRRLSRRILVELSDFLGSFHDASRELDTYHSPKKMDRIGLTVMAEHLLGSAALPDRLNAPIRTAINSLSMIESLLSASPRTVIHGDLRPANLLLKEKKLMGVLDFDDSSPDHAIVDVATVLNHACFDNVDKWDWESFDSACHALKYHLSLYDRWEILQLVRYTCIKYAIYVLHTDIFRRKFLINMEVIEKYLRRGACLHEIINKRSTC